MDFFQNIAADAERDQRQAAFAQFGEHLADLLTGLEQAGLPATITHQIVIDYAQGIFLSVGGDR